MPIWTEDSLFREGTDRLRGDAVILRRVLVRPAPVTRVSLPPGRGEPDEAAEDQTSSTAPVCARDVAVNDTMALLIAGKAPLPVSKDEIKRAAATAGIRDDYKSVAAVVPATAERRLLIFFHGNGNYVTVAPTGDVPPRVEASGHSRVPRWVSAAGRARIIGVAGDPKNKGVAAAQIKYGFLSLAASQQALAPEDSFTGRAVKNPLVLVPENAEVATGSSWAVPPSGRSGTASDGKPSGPGTKRLEELVLECYEHLRCLRNPSSRPYLAPDMSQRASWVSNIQRTYVVGHSGGGKPLVEAAGADMVLITPSSVAGVGGRAVDLWLFDCTYNFREEDGRAGRHQQLRELLHQLAQRRAARPPCRQRALRLRLRAEDGDYGDTETLADLAADGDRRGAQSLRQPACSSCTTATTCRRNR